MIAIKPTKTTTLVVLAGGIGSRYGGVKQLDTVGPNDETILDFSLYDALNAGFDKIVFVVRREIVKVFEDVFAPKLA